MRSAVSTLLLVSGFAFASSDADPAGEWLRADAPHAYLVRQGEIETDVARRFVKDVRHWPEVWCPWPGYEPPEPVAPGDLLVRVRIDGRSWVQRARLGHGDRPHVRALAAFETGAVEPFAWIPDPQAHPLQHLAFDLTEAAVREPARAVHREVSGFWPRAGAQPRPVVRFDAGSLEFLSVGTALTVVPAGKEREPAAWVRVVVAAVFPSYSYALLLEPGAVAAPGDSVRSPTAWCYRRGPVPASE